MAHEMTSFQYRPLASNGRFRILTLQPGHWDDIVQCTLQELSIPDAEGRYECISYVWGSESKHTKIICDGKELEITINLNDALQRFRWVNDIRRVWADAICINQQDHIEKSVQVKKMGEIFHKARRVLCWLGRDDLEIAKDCFDLIQRAKRALETQWQEGWNLDDFHGLKLPDFFSESDLGKIRTLLNLPWFERVWVVQEFGLARECSVFWGQPHLQMDALLAVASWLAYSVHAPSLAEGNRIGQFFSDVFADIVSTFQEQNTWRDNTPSAHIMHDFYPVEKQLYVDLLFCSRSLKATNQRDIIYSSLSSPLALSPDGGVIIEPDYDESLSQLQIRAAYALLRIPKEACHLLLRVTRDLNEDIERNIIPSWVPQWRTFDGSGPRPIPLTYSLENRQLPYCASYGCPPFSYNLRSDNIITVTGMIFDHIVWKSFWLKASDLQSNINMWDPRFRDGKISAVETIWLEILKSSQGSIEESIASFSSTLARGRPKSGSHIFDFLAYCEKIRKIAKTETKSPFPDYDASRGNASSAEWTVMRARDRCFAYTAEGRLALVPLVAMVGDVCCIIQGMNVPLILQQTQQGSYKVAGDTYIQGTMDGELMLFKDSEHPQWQAIDLQ